MTTLETQIDSFDTAEQQQHSYKRLWCAMVSAAVPGLGDWFIGNKTRLSVFLTLFAILLFCYWPLRLPRLYWALLLLPLVGLALSIVSSICTLIVKRESKDKAANWWVLALVVMSVLFCITESRLLLQVSGFRVFQVPSNSMAPTIEAGDKIVVDMRYFHDGKPAPGDVVAFRHHDLILLKRVVAVSGSTISGKNGQVEVDGRQIAEPYAVHRHPEEVSLDELNNFGPTKVPAGQLFVIGDDRDESLDSRVRSGPSDYGPVFVADVVGKAVYRFSSKLGQSEYDGQKIK
jgi:signal peptidase I